MRLQLKINHRVFAKAVSRRFHKEALPAMGRYVAAEARRAAGEWYSHVTRRTGASGSMHTRAYRTGAGNLRGKIGTDAKYARYLMTSTRGKRVLDRVLTDAIRRTVRVKFGAELAKKLK